MSADMAAFSLATGLRASNVSGVQWSQVDMARWALCRFAWKATITIAGGSWGLRTCGQVAPAACPHVRRLVLRGSNRGLHELGRREFVHQCTGTGATMASGESRTRRPALAADGGAAAVGAPGEVTPQQLLRALDALVGHRDEVQAQLAGLLRPLIDQELSVVFDDRPAMGVEGPSELEGDVHQVGLSKDGGIRRQFLRGVVQTAEGWPLPHRAWEGNTAEAPALSSVVDEVLSPYPAQARGAGGRSRAAALGDHREGLPTPRVGPSAQPLEFILGRAGAARCRARRDPRADPLPALRGRPPGGDRPDLLAGAAPGLGP